MELLVDPDFDERGELCADESRHCVSVMRHRAGDTLYVSNGRGRLFTCTLQNANSRCCQLTIENITDKPQPTHMLHMAVAPTKNIDRFEWFVEKATELGVSQITPLICQHSERTHLRLDRLQRLVVAAAKQSLKFHLPVINEPIKASEMISESTEQQRFILHCRESQEQKKHLFELVQTHQSTLVMIGPEGDFSVEEIALALKNDFLEATLGPERLRNDTAAMAACHIVDIKNTLIDIVR